LGVPLSIKVNDKEKQELLNKYPSLKLNNNELNFTEMCYENTFGNILCKKYLKGQFTSINLGISGCGNRATIKELYMHPELNWDSMEKIIVIYCPSGMERFDFALDSFREHSHWICMWPHPQNQQGAKKKLWQGYNECLYSEKFAVIEQIAHVRELLMWCKVNNADLIITPAFDKRYNKDFFTQELYTDYQRDITGEIKTINKESEHISNNIEHNQEIKNLIDMWPWDKMFYPDDFPTFIDMCLGQEFPDDWQNNHFYGFHGKGSPNKFVTKCAHPAAKSHDKFAKCLYDHISKNYLRV
jgi:hypothetical protein